MCGQLTMQSAEVERLNAALATELRASESTRLDLARATALVQASEARTEAVFQDLAALRKQCASIAEELKEEKAGRSLAERRADVAEAKVQIAQQALAAAEAQVTALQAKVAESEGLGSRAAAAEATVMELRGLVGVLQRLLPGAMTAPGSSAATVSEAASESASLSAST
jgi:hypothetical protein